jgi:hypothetical protein
VFDPPRVMEIVVIPETNDVAARGVEADIAQGPQGELPSGEHHPDALRPGVGEMDFESLTIGGRRIIQDDNHLFRRVGLLRVVDQRGHDPGKAIGPGGGDHQRADQGPSAHDRKRALYSRPPFRQFSTGGRRCAEEEAPRSRRLPTRPHRGSSFKAFILSWLPA